MITKTIFGLVAPAALVSTLAMGQAAAHVITFDDLPGNTTVSNEYPGVFFSGAKVPEADVFAPDFFPPVSQSQVVYNLLAEIRVATLGAWSEVGGFITGNAAITLAAYDSSDVLLGSVSTPGENYVTSGRDPNIFLSVASSAGIAYAIFRGPGANTFTLDNFTYAVVPLPGALLLFGSALAGLLTFGARPRVRHED